MKEGCWHAENDQEGRFASQDLRSLWTEIRVATKMGRELGGCQILFGALPPCEIAQDVMPSGIANFLEADQEGR